MGDQGAAMGGGGRLVPGAAGYAEAADALAVQYEEVTFEQVHHEVLHLVPGRPGGCSTWAPGRGATPPPWRPAATACSRSNRRRPSAATGGACIPAPGSTGPTTACPSWPPPGTAERFDAVFATAVWMHLDAAERSHALARIAGLLAPGGRFFLQLRHGPVPAGRRMFEVSAADTVTAGRTHGLRPLHCSERPDLHGRDGVRWSSLVLQADGAPGGA
ncbi:methyltransferase domain-containing protein [Kitasatospora arboriphila]